MRRTNTFHQLQHHLSELAWLVFMYTMIRVKQDLELEFATHVADSKRCIEPVDVWKHKDLVWRSCEE